MELINDFLKFFKTILLYPIKFYKNKNEPILWKIFVSIIVLLLIYNTYEGYKKIIGKSKIEIGNKYNFWDFNSKKGFNHSNKYFDTMIVLNDNTVIVSFKNLKNQKEFDVIFSKFLSEKNLLYLELLNKMKESDNKIKLKYKYDSESGVFEILGGNYKQISPFVLDRIIGKWIWNNDKEGFYNEKNIGDCFMKIDDEENSSENDYYDPRIR